MRLKNGIIVGISLKIIVSPSLTKKYQQELKSIIYKNYKLLEIDKSFKSLYVIFNDGYESKNRMSDDLKGKQMLVKVSFEESNIVITKQIYNEFKSHIAKQIIKTIKSNYEVKTKAKLEEVGYIYELTCYDKALKIDPVNMSALNSKCKAYDNLKKFEQSLKCYDKILKINPNNIEALNNKGHVLKILGKYVLAIKCFDYVIKLDSKNIKAIESKAKTLEVMGRFKEANELFFHHLKIVLGLTNKNLVNMKQDKSYMASQDNYMAFQYKFKEIIILSAKCEDSFELGKYSLALKQCNKAIKISEKMNILKEKELGLELYIGLLNDKGLSLCKLNKYQEAIKCFDKALKSNLKDEVEFPKSYEKKLELLSKESLTPMKDKLLNNKSYATYCLKNEKLPEMDFIVENRSETPWEIPAGYLKEIESCNKELYATFSDEVKDMLEFMYIPSLIGLDFADIRKILEKSTEWKLLKNVDINNFQKKGYNKCIFLFNVNKSITLDDIIKDMNILKNTFDSVSGNTNEIDKNSISLILFK